MKIANPDHVNAPALFPVSASDFIQACSHHADRCEATQAVSQRSSAEQALNGSGLDLREAVLARLDLSGFNLSRATFNRASLFDTNLSRCRLEGASLICAGLERTRFEKANLRGSYVHGFAAQVCDFSEADLSYIPDGTGSLFHGCKFRGALLEGASLAGATFYQCDLSGASFRNAVLQGATFNECHAEGVDFSGANLSQARFLKSGFSHACFAGVSGDGVSFASLSAAQGLEFRGASLPGLTLQDCAFRDLDARELGAPGALLRNLDLEQADFGRASLPRSMWNTVRARDLRVESANLDEASWRQVNVDGLAGANLSAENFHAVDCTLDRACLDDIKGRTMVMRNCALSKASARRAYLYRAMITGDLPARANLRGADLQDSICVQAYVTADLTGANLSRSKLAYARLNQAILCEANLAGVSLYEASLVKTNMTGALVAGLEPPFFADRVHGLSEAVRGLEEKKRLALENYLDRFASVLKGQTNGST